LNLKPAAEAVDQFGEMAWAQGPLIRDVRHMTPTEEGEDMMFAETRDRDVPD
jgi:hypothetical protein